MMTTATRHEYVERGHSPSWPGGEKLSVRAAYDRILADQTGTRVDPCCSDRSCSCKRGS